jgi:hypothetical protein
MAPTRFCAVVPIMGYTDEEEGGAVPASIVQPLIKMPIWALCV